jgi:hypothetical protein
VSGNCYPVPRIAPDAAIGIAAIGPEARTLLPAVVQLGTDREALVYRLRAIAHIGDPSIVSELQRWKTDLKDSPGLVEAVDGTIARIQK